MVKTVTGTDNLLLADVKLHLYVDITEDDTLIQRYIDASLSAAANYMHKDVLLTEYDASAKEIQDYRFIIDMALDKVTITDNSIEIILEQYEFTQYDGQLAFDYYYDALEAVKGVSGYDVIPANVNQARMLLIGSWYANREANITTATSAKLPVGVEFILDSEADGAI